MKFVRNHRAGAARQGGFTLLESLISLVILSVGMLGIAALYVEGLRAGRTAVYRTTAVNLAADMMDRIRANPQARFAYQGGGALNNCVNAGNNCTAQQMAQEDVLLWTNEVAARMPGGVAANVAVANAGVVDIYTITINWPEPGFDAPLSYSLVARL
ncbi:MAG: type IV pilus modification protein PilV [Gammaproteobacteria bacterium]|jgi:type IV pilus assembly protein PilV|nr:type IV pilus modification protein PilV [Gammaproteobacteria bacterium]